MTFWTPPCSIFVQIRNRYIANAKIIFEAWLGKSSFESVLGSCSSSSYYIQKKMQHQISLEHVEASLICVATYFFHWNHPTTILCFQKSFSYQSHCWWLLRRITVKSSMQVTKSITYGSAFSMFCELAHLEPKWLISSSYFKWSPETFMPNLNLLEW